MSRRNLLASLVPLLGAVFLFGAAGTVQAEVCTAGFQYSFHGPKGEVLSGISWAVVVQDRDADGNPVIGKVVRSGRTDAKGLATGTFDSTLFTNNVGESRYAIKVYEVNANAGYFAYWDRTFSCASTRSEDLVLSRLKFVARNVSGESLKNFTFQVHTQKRDIDGKPIPDASVSSSLSTGTTGVKYLYISPGKYIIRVSAVGGLYYQISDVSISAARETSIETTLSSIRLIARGPNDTYASGTKIEVWSQKYDLSGEPIQDARLTSVTIGTTGFADVFLPQNLYAVKAGVTWAYNVKVSANMITEVRVKQTGDTAYEYELISEPRSTPSRPNNTLVKIATSPRVYVLKNGLKYYIPSAAVFSAYGYRWGDVITISADEFNSYVEGPALTLPDYLALQEGDIVKTSTNPAVYRIEGGKKRLFVSAESFLAAGYKWEAIAVVSDAILADFPLGDPILAPQIFEGSIVKLPDVPAVYLIEAGTRRPFTSGRIYIAKGFEWSQVVSVSEVELNKYPLGESISFDAHDFDQDGLTDEEETQYGTDVADDDSDDDGFIDGQEVNNGFNPKGPGLLPQTTAM